MKRWIKAASGNVLFEDPYFSLIEDGGIGINDTPWEGLRVISKGSAKKHVVEIRLKTKGSPDFNGEPVTYQYSDVEVAHGMRSTSDTLEDTEEYIEVLEDAVAFARKVKKYLQM